MKNKPSSLHDQVMQQMRLTADAMGTAHVSRISAQTLAIKVFDHYAACPIETHIEWTSIQHLKQMAREVVRRWEPHEQAARHADGQGDAFSDLLQDRYPASHRNGEEPEYVLREFMSHNDVIYNAHRMDKMGDHLKEHARALLAWDQSRGGVDAA